MPPFMKKCPDCSNTIHVEEFELSVVYPNSGTDSGLHPDSLHPHSGF